MTYIRFCQRLRLARLGIGVGSKSVDACDYCTWFDREVRPAMKASLAEFQLNTNRLDAAVWIAWVDQRHTIGDFGTEGFIASASPTFVQAFCDYVELHCSTHVNDEIKAVAAGFLEVWRGPTGFLEKVYAMNGHWKLMDCQHGALAQCLSAPGDKLCLYWDF